MVNASKFMRQIEGQMHGAMTASERLEKITKIVNDYKIEVEEETNLPYYRAMDQEIANERLSEWEKTTIISRSGVILCDPSTGERGIWKLKSQEKQSKSQTK